MLPGWMFDIAKANLRPLAKWCSVQYAQKDRFVIATNTQLYTNNMQIVFCVLLLVSESLDDVDGTIAA